MCDCIAQTLAIDVIGRKTSRERVPRNSSPGGVTCPRQPFGRLGRPALETFPKAQHGARVFEVQRSVRLDAGGVGGWDIRANSLQPASGIDVGTFDRSHRQDRHRRRYQTIQDGIACDSVHHDSVAR